MDYSRFYTPPEIAHALINELSVADPQDVVDICCGSCNLLLAAKKRWRGIKMYGADINNQSAEDVSFQQIDGRQFAILHPFSFSLVLANPPFGYVDSKLQFPELFVETFEKIATSRLEIEMLIANIRLLKEHGVLLIIMPSSFVEAETYTKIRKAISNNYYIEKLIKLDESTFGSSRINSYALIIRNEQPDMRYTTLEVSTDKGITPFAFVSKISNEIIKSGMWVCKTINNEELKINIKRGNISSSSFVKNGQPILHTSKQCNEWKPSQRYILYGTESTVFAEPGDIVVSRVGKSAGQWCVYNGSKIAISDCLYRIKDPDGSIHNRIKGRKYDRIIKGVATKYITISDFYAWINAYSDNKGI